ncbi:hypothetical protein O9992_27460 [Vibrio lentus]|nr:hypothetical protein [Vibrio lentus]
MYLRTNGFGEYCAFYLINLILHQQRARTSPRLQGSGSKTTLESSEYVVIIFTSGTSLTSTSPTHEHSGDSYALNDADPDASWAYIVPQEGTTLWLECVAAINNGVISTIKTILSFYHNPISPLKMRWTHGCDTKLKAKR